MKNRPVTVKQLSCLANKVFSLQDYINYIISRLPEEYDRSGNQAHFVDDLSAILGTIDNLVDNWSMTKPDSRSRVSSELRNF